MNASRSPPARHELLPEESAPSSTALQLQQVQLLQRRRKSLAAIELAAARNALRACETRLQETSEALEVNRQQTLTQRAQQAREIAQAERSTQDLLRWRHGDTLLLQAVHAHRRAWELARDERAQADEEVARRLQRQRRLEVVDEKYGVLLQDLREEGSSRA